MEMITKDNIISELLDLDCRSPGYIIQPQMLRSDNVLFLFQLCFLHS